MVDSNEAGSSIAKHALAFAVEGVKCEVEAGSLNLNHLPFDGAATGGQANGGAAVNSNNGVLKGSSTSGNGSREASDGTKA